MSLPTFLHKYFDHKEFLLFFAYSEKKQCFHNPISVKNTAANDNQQKMKYNDIIIYTISGK